ncbi:MAG: preQ(1) synthase [bacterium]|nr:preQ(1) synthase [bacterium]
MARKKSRHDEKTAAQFKALGRTLPFTGPEAIDISCLEVFDYQFPGRDIDIITTTEEFTSVCPFSGLPDFGRLTITYTPDRKCVELRSLKYYLMSYRNVGMFYEHVANRILEDLTGLLDPRRMTVECRFTTRGGLQTTVRAEYRQ